ncbi:MAG: carbon monoxide dehydrogenase [Nevskiaceae bacterium]|nr:MAG: carbon monoxide dehydrogenase [Nevskiaceae bacterium]TBR72545.1 MAG: carbon monoxide dehydrogenase [Nevskiaceae bacterium]
MDMQGSRQLVVQQQEAWEALNDPAVLKLCVPGCKSIDPDGENAYKFVTGLKIGPVDATFKGTIKLSDINPPNSYTINFDGNGGAAGYGKGTAQVTLAPKDSGCELTYTAHATVGGRMAQVGQRLVDGVAKQMLELFFKRFNDEMLRRHPELAPKDASKGGGIPKWVWIVVAAAVVAGIIVATR